MWSETVKRVENNEFKVRVNTIIIGEPTKWLDDWKRRRLVTNYADAAVQA
jgi:hypothetical protein